MFGQRSDRAISPAVGVVLLVAIVIIMGVVTATFVLDLGSTLSGTNTGSSVRFDEHSAGLAVTAVTVDNPLAVQYNGVHIDTLTKAGQSIAIPAAPGEKITVLENRTSGERVVVASKNVKHSKPLLGHWEFEGSGPQVSDNSGLGNTGSKSGATRIPDGVQGQAMHFDGSSEVFVDMGVMPNSQVTVTYWMRADATQGRTFTHPFGLGGGHLYTMYIMEGSQDNHFKTYPGGVRKEGGSIPYKPGVWEHWAMSYNGTHITVYKNGTQVSQTTASGPIDFTTSMVVLGNSYGGNGGNYYTGDLDEYRLYNVGMNETQVDNIYQSEKP